MLCHNCDIWHLPKPCGRPLNKCTQCGYFGHLPNFCPKHPERRDVQEGDQPGAKRKRNIDSSVADAPQLVVDINHIHPGLLRRIQQDVLNFCLNILHAGPDARNYVYNTFMMMNSRPAPMPQMPQMQQIPQAPQVPQMLPPPQQRAIATGNMNGMQVGIPPNSLVPRPNMLPSNTPQRAVGAYDTTYGNPYGRKDSSQSGYKPNMMTPAPSSAVKPMVPAADLKSEPNVQRYEAMHQSFARGDLAKATEMQNFKSSNQDSKSKILDGQGGGDKPFIKQDNRAQFEIDTGDAGQNQAAQAHEEPRSDPVANGGQQLPRSTTATPRVLDLGGDSSPDDHTPSTPAPAGRAAPKPRCADCKRKHARCPHPVTKPAKKSGKVTAGADEDDAKQPPENKSIIVRLRVPSKFLATIDQNKQDTGVRQSTETNHDEVAEIRQPQQVSTMQQANMGGSLVNHDHVAQPVTAAQPFPATQQKYPSPRTWLKQSTASAMGAPIPAHTPQMPIGPMPNVVHGGRPLGASTMGQNDIMNPGAFNGNTNFEQTPHQQANISLAAMLNTEHQRNPNTVPAPRAAPDTADVSRQKLQKALPQPLYGYESETDYEEEEANEPPMPPDAFRDFEYDHSNKD